MKAIHRVVALLLAAAVLLAVPHVINGYFLYAVTLTLVYTFASFGTNVLTGYTNLVSLAGAAFFGIGAYATSVLIAMEHWPSVPALVVAGLTAAAIGAVIGLPALRLDDVFLAIATIGFVLIFGELAKSISFIGGASGMSGPNIQVLGITLGERGLYYYILVWVVVLLILGNNLARSRYGRAFFAVKHSETAARAMGVPVPHIKLLAFAVSAFYTGIAGGLYAALVGFIDPSMFDMMVSVAFLSMVIVGGIGSVTGSILGAAFVTLTPQLFTYIGLTSVQRSIYGVSMILSLMFLPDGLAGLGPKLGRLLRRGGQHGEPAGSQGH